MAAASNISYSNESKANQLKNQDNFRQLDGTLQSFILQIGNGSTKMEDLLKTEAEATREHVTKEVRHTEQSVKEHIAGTVRSHEEVLIVQKQHERLLQSLKFPEMYSRQNNIMEPEDATFQRIFWSFDRTTSSFPETSLQDEVDSSDELEEPSSPGESGFSESSSYDSVDKGDIDRIWQDLVDWLRSDEPLFWIQGKPGSGKSTLVKRVASDKATQRLLDAWNSNTMIISHYFYLIGSSSFQQNIVGFYSSVMHQILSKSARGDSLTRKILQQLPLAASKDHLGDWSIPELRDLLMAILNELGIQHVCLFVDGLDEHVGADGPDGLLKMLQAIYEHPKVKMCVSSRPEPRFRHLLRLAPTLRLHDLTWPDMEAYVQLQLDEFIQDGKITGQISSGLTRELLEGAQGVFLWLHLALQSVKQGIRNGDDGTFLMDRVRELPQELEELYASMWKKVNQNRRVYRESAAMYLGLALTGSTMSFHRLHEVTIWHSTTSFSYSLMLDDITLFEMLCCSRSTVAGTFLEPAAYADYGQVEADLETVGKEIQIRCAGLLEINPATELTTTGTHLSRSDEAAVDAKLASINKHLRMTKGISFVHRTARDFLITTTAGKEILRYSKLSSTDLHHARLRAYVCLTRLLWQECRAPTSISNLLGSLSQNLLSFEILQPLESELVRGIQRLYEADLIAHDPASHKRPLASELAVFPRLATYALQQLEDCTASTATDVLRDAWELDEIKTLHSSRIGPPLELVQELLRRGADPFAVGEEYRRGARPRRQINAMVAVMMQYFRDQAYSDTYILEVVEAMMQARPKFVEHDWLVLFSVSDHYLPFWSFDTDSYSDEPGVHLAMCTSDILSLISGSAQQTPTLRQSRLQALQKTIPPTQPCLRFVGVSIQAWHNRKPFHRRFFSVKNQESLPDLRRILLEQFQGWWPRYLLEPTAGTVRRDWQRLASALIESPDSDVLEETEYEEMLSRLPHGVPSSSGDLSRQQVLHSDSKFQMKYI